MTDTLTHEMIPAELVAPIFNPASYARREEVEALLQLRRDYPLNQVEVRATNLLDRDEDGGPARNRAARTTSFIRATVPRR